MQFISFFFFLNVEHLGTFCREQTRIKLMMDIGGRLEKNNATTFNINVVRSYDAMILSSAPFCLQDSIQTHKVILGVELKTCFYPFLLHSYFNDNQYPDEAKREEIANACNAVIQKPGTNIQHSTVWYLLIIALKMVIQLHLFCNAVMGYNRIIIIMKKDGAELLHCTKIKFI